MHKHRLWKWGRQLRKRISNTSRDMYPSRPFSSAKDWPLPPRFDEDRLHLKDQPPCLMQPMRHKHWTLKKNMMNNKKDTRRATTRWPTCLNLTWPWKTEVKVTQNIWQKSSTIQCLKTRGQKPLTLNLGPKVTNVTGNGLWSGHFKVNWTQWEKGFILNYNHIKFQSDWDWTPGEKLWNWWENAQFWHFLPQLWPWPLDM